MATGHLVYRVVLEFWLKVFCLAFGMEVVSGVVMAFEFGTNWEVLARVAGPIQGVLLSYERRERKPLLATPHLGKTQRRQRNGTSVQAIHWRGQSIACARRHD
jgi:hypothetical protein